MNKKLRTAIQYVFFLGLGIFLLWWSAKDLTPDQRAELKHSLAHSKYIFVIPAMFLLLLGHYSRALRWKILMEPLGYNPSTINTFFAVMTGYLFNLFVPRLGEVMKCTILGKYENVPADKLVGTIVAERAFDVICRSPAKALPWLATQQRVFHPLLENTKRMQVIQHHFDFAAGPHHPHQFRHGFFRVRRVVQNTKGISEVERVRFKRKVFRIAGLDAFGRRQAVDLDAMG